MNANHEQVFFTKTKVFTETTLIRILECLAGLCYLFCWEFCLGAWCLGSGLGNLDGWDGDYTIHIFSAGFSSRSKKLGCCHYLAKLMKDCFD